VLKLGDRSVQCASPKLPPESSDLTIECHRSVKTSHSRWAKPFEIGCHKSHSSAMRSCSNRKMWTTAMFADTESCGVTRE
jgi:hypothetical protein